MNTPTLKPCEECQGTGETIIEKHNCDCPDCLGTGYEEPAKRIMNLERELAEARKERDAYKVNMEVARETCDILQDEIAESEKMRKQLAYAHVFAVERAQQYEDQRDTLAEALETVLDEVRNDYMACKDEVKAALAAVKGELK